MNESRPIIVTHLWWLPDGASVEEYDERYFKYHVPLVRCLPGIRRHVLLRIHDRIRNEYLFGAQPPWWRGEDYWFDSQTDLMEAYNSPEWHDIRNGYFASVAGLQIDVAEVEEEYLSPEAKGAGRLAAGCDPISVRGTWHTPAGKHPEALDQYYYNVHLTTVRRLPGALRHVVFKTIEWPTGTPKRSWRGAQVWHESMAEYEHVMNSSERRESIGDGFISMIAGLQLDEFVVEEEYIT